MLRKCLLSLAALWVGATSVLGQDQTIFEITETTPSLSILNSALTLTDLDSVLDCDSFFCRYQTVFAPTNDAFNALPAALLAALTTNPEYEIHLRYILLYHVAVGRVFAADISDGEEIHTLFVETVNTTVTTTGEVFINNAQVTTPDVEASNGVAHVIDAVLLPSFMRDDIIGIATKNGGFTTLLTALETAGLTSALQGPGPFTVFAPTDEAFDKLGSAVVNDLLANVTALTDILTYHVIPDKIVTFSRLEAGDVTTLQGEAITVTYRGFWFFSYPTLNGEVQIEGFDVLASNGVIHVISDVLVPPSADPPAPTITELAEETDDLSTLVAALEATGLNDTLQTAEGPLTVFAPTNAAFDKLGSDTVNGLLADTAALTNILQYHVVSGAVFRSDLEDGFVTTLNGQDVEVDRRGWWFWTRYFLNGHTRITDFDIEAKNGVIHLIDEVLLPPTDIVATATSGGFTTLVAALEATGLNETLVGEGPFTVFAPTEEAFAALGDTLNTLLGQPDTLRQILLYHVVPGRVARSDLETGTVNTAQNEEIEISQECFLFFFCGGFTLNDGVEFVDFNIDASNGIIHSIDEVLIPPSLASSL